VKCPHCLSVCLPTDPRCFSCKSPLSSRVAPLPGAENGKPPYAQRLSMIFMCLGAAGGGAVAGVIGAGVGAMIGGTVGLALGMAIFGTGQQPA
jgi:hypothetical protein